MIFPDPDPDLNFPNSGSRKKFRIHAKVSDPRGSGSNPYYLSRYIWKLQKHALNSIKKINLLTLFDIFYFILQSYSTHRPETRMHREITLLFICSYIFCWIHAVPDPQQCFKPSSPLGFDDYV